MELETRTSNTTDTVAGIPLAAIAITSTIITTVPTDRTEHRRRPPRRFNGPISLMAVSHPWSCWLALPFFAGGTVSIRSMLFGLLIYLLVAGGHEVAVAAVAAVDYTTWEALEDTAAEEWDGGVADEVDGKLTNYI